MYCTQRDLENRLSSQTLATLTNDGANADKADPAVVKALIAKAEAQIDSTAGQIYSTPLQAVLTGTVAISGITITGTLSKFTTDPIVSGDPIFEPTSGQGSLVDSVTSDTVALLMYPFPSIVSGKTLYRIPKAVWSIAVDFASYFAMQRRFSVMSIPQEWTDAFKDAQTRLQAIADMKTDLGPGFNVSSSELSLVSNAKVMDFNNDSNGVSLY